MASKILKLIQHEVTKPAGKGFKIVRTPIGICLEDQAKGVAKAFNDAKIYPAGNVIVTDIELFTNADDVKKVLATKVEAEQAQVAAKVIKKFAKLTDAECAALKATTGVDVKAIRDKRTATETETKTEETAATK